ncbi:MAG: hypothetical protein MJ240_06490 [Kiritimatiellae bacterium]|nr:hypothetical protein [Kiritimatiellia bacterium]
MTIRLRGFTESVLQRIVPVGSRIGLGRVRYALFCVGAAAAIVAQGVVLEIPVPTGTVQTNFTAEQLAVMKTLGAEDEIRKTGGGDLIITSNATIGDFTGTLTIAEGCYVPSRVSKNNSVVLHTTKKGPLGLAGQVRVVVQPGATLYFDVYLQASNNGEILDGNLQGLNVTVGGSGAPGQAGAIVFGGEWSNYDSYNGFYPINWTVTLSHDTTFARGKHPAYFHSASALNMQGHDLTLANGFSMKGVTSVTGAGRYVINGNAYAVADDGSIVFEQNVPEGEIREDLTSEAIAILTDIGPLCEFRKTGLGVLRIRNCQGIRNVGRRIRICAGTYVISDKSGASGKQGPLGDLSSCETIVEDGATLFTDCYSASDTYLKDLNMRLTGAGAPGMGGALVMGGNFDAGNQEWYGFYAVGWHITLGGDTTIARGYSNAYFSTAGDSTIDMQGHTLTINNTLRPVKDTTSGFDFRGLSAITNPGRIIVNGANAFQLGSIAWEGDASNQLVLTNGATIKVNDTTAKTAWTLYNANPGSTLTQLTGWTGGYAGAAGTTWKFAPAANTELRVEQPISGESDVQIAGSVGSRVVFAAPNTYSGTTRVTSGALVYLSKAAAPGLDEGRVTGIARNESDVIAFAKKTDARPDGWTGEEVWDFIKKFRYDGTSNRNWGIGVYVDSGDDFEIPCDFTPQETGLSYTNFANMSFAVFGGGRAVLRGRYPTDSVFKPFSLIANNSSAFYGVTNLVYSAAEPSRTKWVPPTFSQTNTDITYEDVGTVWMGAWVYYYLTGAARDYGRPGRLTIGAGTCMDCIRASGGRALYACGNSDNCSAIITLDGGIISNNIWVASNEQVGRTGQVGGYIQRRGALRSFLSTEVGNGLSIGGSSNSLAYAEIQDGEFLVGPQGLNIGNRLSSRTVFHQKGGTFHAETGTWGRGGSAQMRFSGGTAQIDALANVPSTGGLDRSTNGLAEVIVDGAAAPIFQNGIQLGARTSSTGVVTCAGAGVVRTPFVKRSANGGALVNFNGGGISATLSGSELLGVGASAVDKAVVYAAGAILSADEGVMANVSVPLEAPTGKGIVALSGEFPIACPCGGYVIIRGDGVGASAMVEFDSTKWQEKITGVTILSPGTGYTWAEAEIYIGEYVARIPLEVTLGEDAGTMGLMKVGKGTIVLNAANTYAGDTIVSNGVLKLGVAGALPSSTVKFAGGSLDVAEGVSYPSGLTFDVSGLPFAKGVRYLLADNFTGELPEVVGVPEGSAWTLDLTGGKLRLLEPRGLVINFR